ncbi:MAG: hypothetical protein ACM336_20505 [Acidobacteriota bacterium]
MKRLGLVLACALPLVAGRIDVTTQTFAQVHSGANLIVDFSVWNYGANNAGFSPYPTSLSVNIVTEALGEGEYRLAGRIESLDGSVYVPLTSLTLLPGVFNSAGAPQIAVGVIHGSARLDEALFGPGMSARLVIENLGPQFVVGIGPGYTVRNAVSITDVTGEGPRIVGGITNTVTVANPEPATWALGAGAVVVLFALRRLRSPGARARKP